MDVVEKKRRRKRTVAPSPDETTVPETYEEMLDDFYTRFSERESVEKIKLPSLEVAPDGKKTRLINFKNVCDTIQRTSDDLKDYIDAEFGTTTSVDASDVLIIRGKFTSSSLDATIKRYVVKYVMCKACKSFSTKLVKENRLMFVKCSTCSSSSSVENSASKGFQATLRK